MLLDPDMQSAELVIYLRRDSHPLSIISLPAVNNNAVETRFRTRAARRY